MKKVHAYIFCFIMIVLTGCKKIDLAELSGAELEGTDEYYFDLTGIEEAANRDNALDKYKAFLNTTIDVEHSEIELPGGAGSLFIGDGKAFFYKKHIFDEPEKCWDEIAITTDNGEKKSFHVNTYNQILSAGPVLGTDHLVYQTYSIEDDRLLWHVVETDENLNVINDFPLKCLPSDFGIMRNLAMDVDGQIHFIWDKALYSAEEEVPLSEYMIISTAGEVVFSFRETNELKFAKLIPHMDNHIILCTHETKPYFSTTDTWEKNFVYFNQKAMNTKLMATINCNYESPYDWITMFDDRTLLYANKEGIFRCNLFMEEVEILYTFRNHGISIEQIWNLQVTAEGYIEMIYDGMNYEPNYLRLMPNLEQKDIPVIQLVVATDNLSFYKKAVATFNKKYPAYHIELVSDYDNTKLLTELIAGTGPVLVDTALSGFEDKEKLWLPLDSVLEQLNLSEEIIPEVLDCGKIQGRLYGIVPDFGIETVVTIADDIQAWNYDEFINYVEKHVEYQSICDNGEIDSSWAFMTYFFSHGLDDSYFFTGHGKEIVFDKESFERIFMLLNERMKNEELILPGESLGRVLCNKLTISRPEQIALCRMYYGDNANYIGFPKKEGSVNYLCTSAPLSVRKSATNEEKQIACLFLKVILSYESQSEALTNTRIAFSVRKDVIKEQFGQMNSDTRAYGIGMEEVNLGKFVNNELDEKIFYSLLSKAQPKKKLPKEVNAIFIDELAALDRQEIGKDTAIEHICNRVQLFLEEIK